MTQADSANENRKMKMCIRDRDNVKSAIVISSVTFGIGHIINLFNGSGMELVNNLCQIVFAIAVGFPVSYTHLDVYKRQITWYIRSM